MTTYRVGDTVIFRPIDDCRGFSPFVRSSRLFIDPKWLENPIVAYPSDKLKIVAVDQDEHNRQRIWYRSIYSIIGPPPECNMVRMDEWGCTHTYSHNVRPTVLTWIKAQFRG